MRFHTSAVLLAFLLLSCSTTPKPDPLEAKAQAGDPIAACQFAARELHSCALEKQKGELNGDSERPACMANPVGEDAKRYLDHADVEQEGAGYYMFQLQRTSINVSAIGLLVSPTEEAIKGTEELQADCAELADFLK
jgi:hypothetical protein